MADVEKKSTRNRIEDRYWNEILNWVAKARPDGSGWDALLQELQAFILHLYTDFQEKQQEMKTEIFEKSVAVLLKKFAATLTHTQQVTIYLRLARCFETFGAWEKALETYKNVIDLCKSDDTVRHKAEAYRWIGHIHCMRNAWDRALKAYQRSLWLSQEHNDIINEACATSSLGILAFEQGEVEKAGEHFDKALSLADKGGDLKLMAEIYNNLGAIENVKGRWAQALATYNKSLPVFEKLGETRGLAEIRHNIGMTYADMQRWSDAGVNYAESYTLAKECGDLRLQSTVKLNRVELYITIGDYAFAESLCRQALYTFRKLNDHLGKADAHKFLGVINSAWQKWKEAKQEFAQSIRLAKKYSSPLCEAESHFEFGKMWQQKGNITSARKQLELALALFKNMRAEADVAKVKEVMESL